MYVNSEVRSRKFPKGKFTDVIAPRNSKGISGTLVSLGIALKNRQFQGLNLGKSTDFHEA